MMLGDVYVNSGTSFNDVYSDTVEDVMRSGNEMNSRNGLVKELHPAFISISHPGNKKLVTSIGRPINVAFAMAEVIWILSGRRDVEMLKFYNSGIENYSDDGKVFNAAYGYRLRHSFGHDQLKDVVRNLKEDQDSRQATLVISQPKYDKAYNFMPEQAEYYSSLNKRETKDRACNVLSHLLIRDGKLDWMQVLRSNDAIWGTPYNWMQFSHLHEAVSYAVGIPQGRYFHIADSLHIYQPHWDEAKKIKHFDLYEELGNTMMYSIGNLITDEKLIRVITGAEEMIRSQDNFHQALLESHATGGARYWLKVLHLLAAHSEYRAGNNRYCLKLLINEAHPVYGPAQARFYWHQRWSKKQTWVKELTTMMEKAWPERVVAWIKGEL